MDSKQGIADEHGIPWQGKVMTDTIYFRNKTLFGNVMMGGGWYKEQLKPLANRHNLVATNSDEPLREGFEKVTDARKYLQESKEDIWLGGGAALFASTLDLANELYITQLQIEERCTKFFPDFKDKFELVDETPPQIENGFTFTFQLWKPKKD